MYKWHGEQWVSACRSHSMNATGLRKLDYVPPLTDTNRCDRPERLTLQPRLPGYAGSLGYNVF